jgi:hypothetical protein
MERTTTKEDVSVLKYEMAEMKKEKEQLIGLIRDLTTGMTELKTIIKGDGSEENPGIVEIVRWVKKVRIYVVVTIAVLTAIGIAAWSITEGFTFIKEHYFTPPITK